MDIFLALLRTLIFVVATVVATVYVGRRIARGHALLWTGTTLLVTAWLIEFGWTTYAAGSPEASPQPTGWLSWVGHLLPFLAALALIWGIGQAAGASTRRVAAGRAGAQAADGGASGSAAPEPVAPVPAGQPLSGQGPTTHFPTAGAGRQGGPAGGGSVVSPRVSPTSQVPGARTPTQSRPKPTRPPGLIVPHAVPVVMTPSASHHSPPDPDPVVDLGPDDESSAAGTPVPPPSGWAPVVPPVQAPDGPVSGSSGPSASPDRPAER